MQFLNLDREYECFDYMAVLAEVFQTKHFINGPAVSTFEDAFSIWNESKYTIGVSSGTDAITVALMALGKKNPVVLTTPYTFIATVESPIRLGCKVIFCDVDLSFNIDMDRVKETIRNQKVDVFLPVHLFGNPCSLDDELLALCEEKGVAIIEDCAQATGSKYGEKRVGNFGIAGCFSFFPAKNLGCAGDGGCITTNSVDFYKRCMSIRNHGSKKKYLHETEGGNFRLDTIQAAILLAKMSHIDGWVDGRRNIAKIYDKELSDIVKVPVFDDLAYHSYNQYVVQADRRDDLSAHLSKLGIPTQIYYPLSLQDQPCYKGIDFGDECVISRLLTESCLALPIGYLTVKEAYWIAEEIRRFYA